MVNHGMSIDARHVMLLADLMCFKVIRAILPARAMHMWSLLLLIHTCVYDAACSIIRLFGVFYYRERFLVSLGLAWLK